MAWTSNVEMRRPSAIDELLAERKTQDVGVSRYGDEGRHQAEREDVREAYLAIDVRLRTGDYIGFFYYDLAGGPRLSADHTILTVPFKEAKLVIRGYRLLAVYRAILHHSLDVLEETTKPGFQSNGDEALIESIEIVDRKEVQ